VPLLDDRKDKCEKTDLVHKARSFKRFAATAVQNGSKRLHYQLSTVNK